jgi:hypothetical protein
VGHDAGGGGRAPLLRIILLTCYPLCSTRSSISS